MNTAIQRRAARQRRLDSGKAAPRLWLMLAVAVTAALAAIWVLALGTNAAPAPAATATVKGRTYYIRPGGSDSSVGTSAGSAWGTFGRAWETLQAGDTLLVMDGTYLEAIQPDVRNGEAGKPITIRALNDGKAVIDGQGERIPIKLGDNWGSNGAIGDWFVVEGFVVRNGLGNNIRVDRGHHNVLRRVSAYDVDTNINSQVILFAWSSDNLIEDCVAAGTGRYMIDVYDSHNITVRRCLAMWREWNGKEFCGVAWPNGNNVGVYNSSDTTVENVVAYGRALTGIFVQANDDAAVAKNNQVLGSMALLSGRDADGSVWTYGTGQAQPTSRPGPTSNDWGPPCDDNITKWEWGNQRVGFHVWGQGTVENNVFRDVLATGNMGIGFGTAKPYGVGDKGTVLDHATLWNNGVDVPEWEGRQGGNINLTNPATVTNSRIANSSYAQGEGARFVYRYIDRQLTNQPLLPWPMESRVQAELRISVKTIIRNAILGAAQQ